MIASVRTRLMTSMVGVVAVGTLLAGCGGDDSGSSSSPSASTAAEKVITLTITDGKVDPQLSEVDVSPGQKVKLTVTSDVTDEVHAHTSTEGVELELQPNEPGTMELTAPTVPGVYEVETHITGILLFNLTVK